MTVQSNSVNLDQATSAHALKPRFEEEMSRVSETPIDIEGFDVTRVFPRSEGGFTIQYDVRLRRRGNGSVKRLYLCARLLGGSEPWPAYASDDHSAFALRDLRLAVPVFPFDPELPVISRMCSPLEAPAVLEDALRDTPLGGRSVMVLDHEILGYRLEKRCVMKVVLSWRSSTAGGREARAVVIKMARSKKLRQAARNAALLEKSAFAADGRVPRTYAFDPDSGLQVMEFVGAPSVHALLSGDSLGAACEGAARAIMRLHETPAEGLDRHGVEDELEGLDRLLAAVGSWRPSVGAALDGALRRLRSVADGVGAPERLACIHRDFYDKQVLYEPNRTVVLDLDGLAAGDPAQDFGNFTAHLGLRAMQEPANASGIARAADRFQAACAARDARFDERVRWWRSASLLRLAALYSLRPRWRHLTEALVEAAITGVAAP